MRSRKTFNLFGALLSLFFVSFGLAQAVRSETKNVVEGHSSTVVPHTRFVSLKADRINVRQGPSQDHKVTWVFRRAGLPVEIIAEFEHWRQIRDSEGQEGWIFHSLLSARRTALVLPWVRHQQNLENSKPEYIKLFEKQDALSQIIAHLEAGTLVHILECDGQWCHLSLNKYKGWMEQEKLWGVYRDEKIN